MVAAVGLGACTGTPGGDDVTVAAAASLNEAFRALAGDAADPAEAGIDVDVALSFAGSATVVEQVRQGTPVDVVAVADAALLDPLAADGLLDGDVVVFARNRLTVATPPGDGRSVERLVDLARPGTRVVMAAEGVPAGDLAREHLRDRGLLDAVLDRVVSFELDVTAVAAKLALGEADAGFVYVTDVRAHGLRTVGAPFPEEAVYAAAVVEAAPNPGAARRLVAWLRSDEAQATLRRLGFSAPPSR